MLIPILFQLLTLVLLLVVVAIFIYIYSLKITRAPFIPLPKENVEAVIEALALKPGSVLYDLGSGDGRIVLAAALAEPKATCVGVDKAIAAYVAASWTARKAGKPQNVRMMRTNFFAADLSSATHVFCFLFPGAIMADLEKKFQAELKPGSRVVACDYKLPNKQPTVVLPIPGAAQFGKTLFVYEY